VVGRPFAPGVSGNPGGRPDLTADVYTHVLRDGREVDYEAVLR
jgi:hypothetical protein